jgi:hypothetical protein
MNKTFIAVTIFGVIFACSEVEDPIVAPTSSVPAELSLNTVGIRLESNFVTNEAKMNVRLDAAEKVTIKIVDIAGKVVSSETVEAKKGDNVLSVYTKALPRSSYELLLYNSNNKQIGKTVINLL